MWKQSTDLDILWESRCYKVASRILTTPVELPPPCKSTHRHWLVCISLRCYTIIDFPLHSRIILYTFLHREMYSFPLFGLFLLLVSSALAAALPTNVNVAPDSPSRTDTDTGSVQQYVDAYACRAHPRVTMTPFQEYFRFTKLDLRGVSDSLKSHYAPNYRLLCQFQPRSALTGWL